MEKTTIPFVLEEVICNMTKNTKSNQPKPITIKEFNMKDEDELLDSVTLWSESDDEWDRGGEWIIPEDRLKIKDLFKYEKIISLEIKLDCKHIVKCYLDFGDESPIKVIDDFSITKKDGSLILKADISHLYSKKMIYTVKLKVETTCHKEDYKTDIVHTRLKNMVIIKRVIIPLELTVRKLKYLKSIMEHKRSIILGTDVLKFYSHIIDQSS